MINTVIQKTTAEAEADRVTYQNIIEEQEQGAELVAVKANLDKAAALIIPVPRLAEFNAASDTDKVRFVSVASKALQRSRTDGDYLTLFEDEYTKEFG